MNSLPAPTIEWAAFSPVLIVLAGAVIGLAIEAFAPRKARPTSQMIVALLSIAASIVAVVWRLRVVTWANMTPVFMPSMDNMDVGTLFEDRLSLIFQLIILVCSMLAVFVMADRTSTREGSFAPLASVAPGSGAEQEAIAEGRVLSEIYPVALFSVAGMMTFTAAGDLVTLFVALELLSLPLYILTATARRRRALSQEAAVKYFLLGSFSSAFFLMGSAFLYGYSSTVNLFYIASVVASNSGSLSPLLVMGFLLILVGFLFKVGAVPFHAWTPDVYQGAPTPITGFMAAGTKIAAYAALLRFVAFASGYFIGGDPEPVLDVVQPVLWGVIVLTILVGTVLGIVQKDVKRMLAYSSIAHTGFILIAIPAIGIPAIAIYLLGYGLASVGAFAIVTLVRERGKDGAILGEGTNLDNWRGLGKTNPYLATAMTIFLLSFAGIPLTAGFMGKFLVFRVGIATGQTWLVVLAV
ncbi:MAG: NADH-quinone oxidoreductase subunit NuoN, partial [Actinomycetaceae bacterium]|nr:NADH-quinone oxidoreductase subunit NuoN [Actinomycetaceae bacterium]